MENRSKAIATFKHEPNNSNNDVIKEISNQKLKTSNNYEEAGKELNAKILKITLKINDQYSELPKYLEEMPVTIPVDKKPEITVHNLNAYYESLNVMLNKNKKEHP